MMYKQYKRVHYEITARRPRCQANLMRVKDRPTERDHGLKQAGWNISPVQEWQGEQ